MSKASTHLPAATADEIHIAVAADANYFDGVAATVLSVARANRAELLHFHILDGGLSSGQKRFLADRLSRVEFHRLDMADRFTHLPRDYGGSHMTYARVLLGSVITRPRVLYLDSDLLIAGNIRPLWELEMGNTVVAAARDPGIQWLKNDLPFDAPDANDHAYFNAGVMLIDLDRWRAQRVETKCLELLSRDPERFRWWDQTAMNFLLRGQVKIVDARWNTWAAAFDEPDADLSKGTIYHFVGSAKPWTDYLLSRGHWVWHRFYDQHVRPWYHLLLRPSFLTSFLLQLRAALFRRPWKRCTSLGAIIATPPDIANFVQERWS